ncbi:MAG: hypothetical protein UR89_C0016G0005 [Candidatus Roizmanbacteria bacterium GW2011_GWA2_35_8]|uniref:Uncharacterized protein n=1 Tax=Candidatus Roizmanbacteria bacterium GW2011_GWA2_35_8 TaxID=1618479 RepID=A0A0G0DDG0_9BACT|nr:MAG: hypothetical protein UR89_C0016G0005 [Candidatus Roizmanbacteria bacterium GW2011_GWA2_35_8]
MAIKERLISAFRNFTPLKAFFKSYDREEAYLKSPRITLRPNEPSTLIKSNRERPEECVLFVNNSEVTKNSPLIVFPEVDKCMFLVGHKGSVNFFGHLSPETVTDGQEREVNKISDAIKLIDEQEGEVEIYYINRSGNYEIIPEEVKTVSELLAKSGLRVAERQLDERLLRKSFAFDLNEKKLKVINNYSSVSTSPKVIGAFFTKPISAIE